MKLVYPFKTEKRPELSHVGGKGMSLILMTQKGLPVPPGFVLSVAFFEPWLEHIKSQPEWASVLKSSPEELKRNCDMVKDLCNDLELNETQKEALSQAMKVLKRDEKVPLFAVRSSSPEEDLEGASFAGGYETILGAKEEDMEDVLRRSFASCLDERVFLYKKEHGFSVDEPHIAVIIQRQIASEKAGVAFSLNPLNNCYDEASINANFGLGESVVSGMASPDTFIIDKVSHEFIEKKVGKKETSIWLSPDGGTYEKPSNSSEKLCLSSEEVLELTEMLEEVEDYYQKPIDIEWAFAKGKLYLLQARPITAYIPLPEVMLTKPGEPKRLYSDTMLTAQGINVPLTVLGTDYFNRMARGAAKYVMGSDRFYGIENGFVDILEGRSYMNISNMLKIQRKRIASGLRTTDVLSADAIENLDISDYIPKKLPKQLKGLLLGLALNIPTLQNIAIKTLKAMHNPEKYHEYLCKETKKLDESLDDKIGEKLSIKEFALKTIDNTVQYGHILLPASFAVEITRSRIKSFFKNEGPEIKEKIMHLERSLPNNVTIEMGLAMYRLASFKEIKQCATVVEFLSKMENGSFSPEFIGAWESFMEKYGFRCPVELDVASPRFYERPEEFYNNLRILADNTDEEKNPQVIFDKGLAERQNAYEFLLLKIRSKGKYKERRFKKNYKIFVEFAAYREIPKYYTIMMLDRFRKRVLSDAQSLFNAGRLDSQEQVFDLTIDDLEKGLSDSSVDLRSLAEKNTTFLKKIQHIHNFPRIIDSRGRILRPPKKEVKDGEISGEPISSGIIRGKVKVLSRPDEKPILPGEILVTRATDPGWTPLFLNAGGIILEVGGFLQHGALVAREYGKPCITGIENVTLLLSDGQLIEMDGASGVIKILDSSLKEIESGG